MTSFTHAGVSKLDGKFKVRFANGAERIKALIKNQHTDIDMIELKYPMSKADAIAFLVKIDFANGNAMVQAAIDAAVKKRKVKLVVEAVVDPELETA